MPDEPAPPRDPAPLVRPARPDELGRVHLHGRDAWGDGLTEADWLEECRRSAKYAAGTWYALDIGGEPVASLIVYEGRFSLPAGAHGIGSVATSSEARGRGHASALVAGVATRLEAAGSRGIWLFSDIDPGFYARLGFGAVRAFDDTVCMVRPPLDRSLPVPERF